MDLVEFLLARIAEDENIAQMVLGDYATNAVSWDCPCTGVVQGPEDLLVTGDGPLAQHIAHWDPARVLAECEAKREIVDYLNGPDRTVLLLMALPYADHPDYNLLATMHN